MLMLKNNIQHNHRYRKIIICSKITQEFTLFSKLENFKSISSNKKYSL